jgi:hypothetical protein
MSASILLAMWDGFIACVRPSLFGALFFSACTSSQGKVHRLTGSGLNKDGNFMKVRWFLPVPFSAQSFDIIPRPANMQ